MNKKDILFTFIKNIEKEGLLTKFISNLFDYNNLHDYNYIFRIIKKDKEIIIDIYDNISDNRFNRYIFDFSDNKYINKIIKEGSVFVTHINVVKTNDNRNKLYKLAYLIKLNKDEMIQYGKTFLDKEIIDILEKTIKK